VFQDYALLSALSAAEKVAVAANLADEPTANLDAAHGRDIGRLLRTLADTDGRAVVIVSHDERLRDIADRVLWLEDGTFAEMAGRPVDPVCGMSVAQTGPSLDVDGRRLWFCAVGCRDEYLARHPAGRSIEPAQDYGGGHADRT
jgi:putative ABC transport system ATP-binding protein